MGSLWGERAKGAAGTLLKVPATGGEATKGELPSESYWTQKANEMHDDACLSETECVILLINDTPYETYLPK